MAKKTKKDYLTEEEYNARRLRSAAATGKDGSTYTTGGKATTSYEDYKNYVNSQENEEYWEEHSGTYEPGYGSDPAKAARKNETDARLSTRSRLHSNNPRSKYSGDSDFTHSVRAKKAQEAQEKLEKKRESKDTKFGIKFNDRTDEGFRNSKGQTFGEWLTEIKETGNTPEGLEPLRSDEEVYSIQVNRLVNNLGNWLETDFPDRHNVESNYAMYSREIQRHLEQSAKFAEKYKNDPKLRSAFEDTSKVLMSLQNSLNYAANTREATLKDMTVGSIKQGYYQKRLGEELNKQMMGEENEVEKYAKLLASDEFNYDSRSWLKRGIVGGGNLAGQIGGTVVDPNTWALVATDAAVGGGIGSAVPGIGTIGGTIAGAGAGFVQSATLNAYEIESGFAYQELLDNGIDPALAKKIAVSIGVANAGLEMVQADTLVDAFKVVKKAGAETVAGKIAQELSRRGLDVGKETAQEVAQEATTIIGAQAASKIQNDKWQYTSDEVKDRLKETAVSSALGFGVLNAPAGAVNTGRTISRNNQNLDFLGKYVKAQDAAEIEAHTEDRIRAEEPEMGEIDRKVTAMAVSKKANGAPLTAAEEYHISKSPVAQRILEESATGTLQAGNNVTKLIDDASKSKDEKTVKLAKNLQSKLETGQRLSDREVGKLYTYVNKTTEKRGATKSRVTKSRAAKEIKSDTPIETKTNIERQAESKVDTSEARTQVIVPDSLGSNKTATLKSISIEDDGTYVELDNGEKVLADDVNLNKGVKQIIDDFAHYDTELANQAVMSYVEAPQETKEVQSPTTFSRQFSLAVEYSRLGRPMEFAVRSGTINTLSETQLQTAYSIGQRLSSVSAKQKFIDDSRVLGQRRKGSFSINGVKLAKYKRTLSKKGYASMRKEIALIEALTQTTGLNIVLEESTANDQGVFMGANGWMDKDGTIHLDVNALRDTTSDENSMMLYTLSHELTHLAKVYSPQMWKEYSDFMIRVMEENGESLESLIQAKKEEYASMGQTLTNDQALEEIVAQGSQMCLTNSSLLERMAWENMTMFQRFKAWVLRFIEDIKRTYRTYDKNLGREADAVIDRLDEVAARFEELQIDAIRAMNETPVELDSKMLREVKDQNGEALFQYRTMSQDLDNYMGDIKKAGIMTDEEISQLRTDILEIMKLIASNMEVLDYNHDMDKSNRPFSPVKLNGDPHYKAALDFSTLCRKRLLQQTVIEALQTKLERAASAEEQVAIREELSKMRDRYDKIQVACALCYVEAARLATPNATNEFFSIRITREDGTVEFVESLEDLDPKDEKNKSKIVETINVREKAIVEHFALKSKWFKDEKKKISKEMFGEEKISKDEIKEKVFDILMGKSNDKLTDNAEAYPVTANVVADFEKKAAEIREKKRKKPEEIEKSLEREARRFANLVRDEYYDTTVARRMGYKEHMTDKEKEIAAELETIPKEEFLSASGLAKMSLKNPEIYDAFISYVRNRARSKALEGRVPYVRGDLVNTKKAGGSRVASNALLVAMNLESGFRHQSWSDFEAMHILDLIGAIIDFSTINIGTKKKPEYGIKAHAYTKVADMVRVCGYTGMMLNMSLIPSKTGFKEGVDLSDPSKLTVADLDFDSVEGMAYEVMMELRDLFPETAGNIAIGMNERQIELLMESDEIDYIIPYHRSGLPKELAGRMSLGEWDDFQDYQNPTEKRDEGSSEKPKEAKGPALKDWFDIEEGKKAEDGRAFMREASKKYIELCNKKNIVPPFPQLLNKRDDGTYELKNENSNYWKVLIDRKMVNHKTNKIIEQKKVQPKFDTSAIMAVLMREVSSDVREQNDQASNEIIQKILKGELHISDQMTKDVQELAESGRLEEKLNADAKAVINNPLINAIAHKDFVKMSPETGDIEVYARPDEFDEQALGKFINKQKKKTGINLTVYDYQGEEVFNVSWEKGATWKSVKKVLTDYYNKGIIPGEAAPVFDEDTDVKFQLRSESVQKVDDADIKMFKGKTWEQFLESDDLRDYFDNKSEHPLSKYHDERGRIDHKAVELAWYITNLTESAKGAHQISMDEADEIIGENISDSTLSGWFRNADSGYKPKIEEATILNPDLRNAALNVAYKNYVDYLEIVKREHDVPNFKTWLQTPITMYRGTRGKKKVKYDVFDAYSYDPAIAKKFGNNITEIQIKPIDTLGTYRAIAEAEVMVPTRLFAGTYISGEEFVNADNVNQLRNYEIAERDEFAEAMETYAKTPAEKRVLNEYRRRLNEYIRRRLYRDSVYDQLSATKQESEKKRLNKSLLDAEKDIRKMDAALFRMESNSQPVKDLLAKQTKEIVKGVKVVERAVREQKVQDEIDKRRAQMARFRENVHDKESKAKLRTHIKKKVKRLDDMLRHATNTRHIPDSLHDAVIQFCEVFTDNTSIFTKTQLDDIRAAYEMMKEGGRLDDIQLAGQYDENIPEMLNDLRETMVGKRLSELTVSELEKVANIIDHLNHIVNNENTIFFEGKRQQVSELAKEAILEAQKDGPKKYLFKSGLSKFVGIQNLTPVTFFDNVGPVFKGLFNEMMTAQNDWGRQMEETSKYFEKIAAKYHYYDWSEHTKKRDKRKHYPMTTERGDKISLTIEEAMGLYATWKREQLDETQRASHLSNGGFVKQDAVKEKKLKGIVTYQVDTKDAHPLTQKDMTHIANKILKDDQKAYADELVRYMSEDMAALGNEASQMMHGYSKFKVKYYYPYKSSDMYLKAKLDSPESTPMIKSVGFSKNLTPNANNPVVARDFTDVFTEHVTQMIYYRYMAPAQDNFMRVYNYQTPPEAGSKRVAVKAEISTGYGQNANDYILQFMRDIYGGTKMDLTAATMDKAISLFKQNAVMMSASVVIQQPTSLLRAFAMINPKYFAGVGFSKKAYDEMYKHSGIAVIKSMGRFDIYTSRSTSSWLTKRKYDGFEKAKGAMSDADYRNDLMARAPQKADEMAWTMLWNAVKKETLAKTDLKKDSEEFFAHVTKRFNDIVNHTQVYDSVFVRSQNMRSKDPLMKMMTAFMSEPTLYLNMAYNGLKQGHAFKVAGVLLFAIVLNDLAKSLVYAGRDSGDDDDDKTYIEKYIAEVVGNFKEDINPVTYIPFLKDIWSVWEGYDIERSDMSIVTDIRDRLKIAIDSDASLSDRITALAESVGIITGVPVKNVMRDIDTTINIIFRMPLIEETTPDGVKLAILEELQKDKLIGRFFTFTGDDTYDKMSQALIEGDMETYNKMREKAEWFIQAQNESDAEFTADDADKQITNAVKNQIKESYLGGEIKTDRAEALLKKVGVDENDAYFEVEKWEYESTHDDEYSKYGKLRDAVRAGKGIEDAKKELMSHGVKEENIDKQISEEANNIMKEEYYPAFDKAIADKDVQRYYEERQKMGNYRQKITGQSDKDIDSWLKSCTTKGIRMAYESGKISYSDAVSMLQGLNGYSYRSASGYVSDW